MHVRKSGPAMAGPAGPPTTAEVPKGVWSTDGQAAA